MNPAAMTTAAASRSRPSSAVHAVTLILFLAASSVPTPLYRLYQQEWGFTPVLLTVIFGVYALALLAALLMFGSLSDRVGRRPVIVVALLVEMLAILVFLAASSPDWLLAARITQGVATGLATASLGAALLDINHRRGSLISSLAMMVGAGVGAVGSSLLVRYAPAPLHFGFVLLLALCLLQAGWTWAAPEPATRPFRGVWTLRPTIAVPAHVRGAFMTVTPINVAVWAIGGFYLALAPSLLTAMAGPAAAWMGGLAVAALTTGAAVAILLIQQCSATIAITIGAAALIVGLAGVIGGVDLGSPGLLLASSVAAGAGTGAGLLGSVRCLTAVALPHERGALMAALYSEGYLAYALPAIAAGAAAQSLGLIATANIFSIVLIVLATLALGLALRLHAAERRLATV